MHTNLHIISLHSFYTQSYPYSIVVVLLPVVFISAGNYSEMDVLVFAVLQKCRHLFLISLVLNSLSLRHHTHELLYECLMHRTKKMQHIRSFEVVI